MLEIGSTAEINDTDEQSGTNWMQPAPEPTSVAHFLPGSGIQKLELKFDIDERHKALA